ncbi:MAG: redoxin domain-containing protein [Balneola sp.]|jgi:peroxiredoxin
MKINLLALLIIITIFGCVSSSQERVFEVKRSETTIQKLDLSKIFYKESDTRIPEDTIRKIINKNPRLSLERKYDDEGNIYKYLYDPDDQNVNSLSLRKRNFVTEGLFPNFRVKTIDGKEIELKSLTGKLVILRFDFFSEDPKFKKHEIDELDKKINAFGQQKIQAIIFFGSSIKETINGEDFTGSNFDLVADANNFFAKYGITRFPFTVILDEKGNLLDNFAESDKIDLTNY